MNVIGMFPTPLARIESAISAALVSACVAAMRGSADLVNPRSPYLRHTEVVEPSENALYQQIEASITEHLVAFGEVMFGERLPWHIKEIWCNVLASGGAQAMHTHANSFISGVLYLTDSDPSARTVFHKGFGGRDFIFSNEHRAAALGPFSGSKFVAPPCGPGDLLLFPSYVPHEVPPNKGAERMTIALNAIPARLNTWGYQVGFSSSRA